MANHDYEVHEHDVIVIGAGGAGLRAAIEAAAQGVSVGLVCKSLLGKAHTVMAEGGIAAALGNVWPEDNWQVHFRDTIRGGKMLNNWRMAQLHAQEAPDRVLELERWGALFDRTKDGRILQRDFGGHPYARLAHGVGRSRVWGLVGWGGLGLPLLRGADWVRGGRLLKRLFAASILSEVLYFWRDGWRDCKGEGWWCHDKKKNSRRTPGLLPRDEVA